MNITPSSGCRACFLLLGTSFRALLAQLQLHGGGLCGVCDAQLFLDPLEHLWDQVLHGFVAGVSKLGELFDDRPQRTNGKQSQAKVTGL